MKRDLISKIADRAVAMYGCRKIDIVMDLCYCIDGGCNLHLERRESPAVRWIDMKIMQAWTTERIWAEYKDLCRVMPEDVWEKHGKQWINNRRLELIK